MTKKVLFVSHVANFQKFNRSLMDEFKNKGWRVDYVSAGEEDIEGCDKEYKLPIARSPLSPRNIKAIFALRKILRNNKYDLIHCHTPTGGVVARLANLFAGKRYRTKIIYTAHGFHFYKGAPLLRWLLLYPIEKVLSYVTDAIITINQEDYELATHKFGAAAYKINGVGVDLSRFSPVEESERAALRKEYGFSQDDFIMIYVADLRKDKNQLMIVRNIDKLRHAIPNLKVLFVGKNTHDESYAAIHAAPSCQFLGYRRDIDKLFQLSDIAISTSVREGLGLNLIEALASGTPVVCSNIRGHSEIVEHKKNGLLFDLHNDEQMVQCIKELYANKSLRQKYAEAGLSSVKKFSKERAVKDTWAIYQEVLREK